jgi:hypothetical protein
MHTLPCVQSIMHDVPIQSMHQMPSWGSWDASDDSLVSSFCASVRLFLIRRREIAGGLLASHEKESSSIDLQIFVWSPGLARKRVQLDRPNVTLCKRSCTYIRSCVPLIRRGGGEVPRRRTRPCAPPIDNDSEIRNQGRRKGAFPVNAPLRSTTWRPR